MSDYDYLEAGFAGAIAGAAIGASVGALVGNSIHPAAAAVAVVTWYPGAIIGFFVGALASESRTVRAVSDWRRERAEEKRAKKFWKEVDRLAEEEGITLP